MKRNKWILLLSALTFSFLFYEENPGLNVFIFNVILIFGLKLIYPANTKSGWWYFLAGLTVVSSATVLLYGNALSMIAWLVATGLISTLTLFEKGSVVFSFVAYFLSMTTAPARILMAVFQKREGTSREGRWLKNILMITIPVLVTLIFALLYSDTNPVFGELLEKINIDFISIPWLFFTLCGLVLTYGFLFPEQIQALTNWENKQTTILIPSEHKFNFLGSAVTHKDEIKSGVILFLLLNAVLLLLNGIDLNFLFLKGEIPFGVSHSEYVHSGVGSLVFSILLAIFIILFYFRGATNFSEENKLIKLLALIWIAQNVLLLFNTASKNQLYIVEHGLTYKRIGVYVYLFLCAGGLVTTFIKITRKKSNYYLFRTNGWISVMVLILCSPVNWDVQIADFNLRKAKTPDVFYLCELSDAVLPELIEFRNSNRYAGSITNYETENGETIEQKICKKLFYFLERKQKYSWKSWTAQDHYTLNRILRAHKEEKLNNLSLQNSRIEDLRPLEQLPGLQALDLSGNGLTSISGLANFNRLHTLILKNNSITSLEGIEQLGALEKLDISENPIENFAPLFKMKRLRTLIVGEVDDLLLEQLKIQLPDTMIL